CTYYTTSQASRRSRSESPGTCSRSACRADTGRGRRRAMRIAMLDPGNYSPLYDANLCHALAGRGHEVSLATSEFLFEPVPPLGGYRVEYDFFRLVAASGLLRRRARTRRLVKAAAYPVEMARWTARTARR